MAMANEENSVALGFRMWTNPNRSAVKARAIQVPRLSSIMRNSTPRKTTSSTYPETTAVANVGTTAVHGFEPVTW